MAPGRCFALGDEASPSFPAQARSAVFCLRMSLLRLLPALLTVSACSLFGEGESLLPQGGAGAGGEPGGGSAGAVVGGAGAGAAPSCEMLPADNCGEHSPICEQYCEGGIANGQCSAASPFGTEDCQCPDCSSDLGCVQSCLNDGFCDLGVSDGCLCDDCAGTGYCYTAAFTCCDGNGICDVLREACDCADCQQFPHCVTQLAACDGAVTDATCSGTETCDCPDCVPTMACSIATCVANDVCDDPEACICNDCLDESRYCPCLDDDFCDALNERCNCLDCASEPFCTGGGLGGAGGAGL